MNRSRFLRALVLVVALPAPAWAQVTRRVSVSSTGQQGDGPSVLASISADGLTVAFDSIATSLVGTDTNGDYDIFVHGWSSGQTSVVSLDSSSALGNEDSVAPSVSADGCYVAFQSTATNLVAGDTNGKSDVFVRDRVLGTTQRVSLSSVGAQANDHCFAASISHDGRYVAFQSTATNLVAGDTNAVQDIFVRDRLGGLTERVSSSSAGAQANGSSDEASISGDGRFVAFESDATNLVTGDTNAFQDIFVRDRVNGLSVRATVNNGSTQGNGDSFAPSMSADGRYVAFASDATNLIGPLAFDQNGVRDVFRRDLVDTHTSRVSLGASNQEGNQNANVPSISADGRLVAFQSRASNLVPGDTNDDDDVFVRDVVANTTELVSVASNGAQGNDTNQLPSISADGRFVLFASDSTNLVPGDTNAQWDVFVHDRMASGFTSVCHPGVDGVGACPCGNPPSVAGRGCNNSAATGGALLTASGRAYLSSDNLLFTTFAEKPTALSILLQGKETIGAGAVFGQGVGCVGGSLERLFTKTASAGSITAPGLGDPSVSAQSAAKGDTIQPGRTRWYLVYYRDGQVLGGCPSTSTFNATQTGRVIWMS